MHRGGEIHGRTKKAVEETIRICKDRDVLKEYLAKREKEVIDIMMTLYDEEYIMRAYTKDVARETVREAVEMMIREGEMPLEKIASYFPDLSVDNVRAIESEMKQLM